MMEDIKKAAASIPTNIAKTIKDYWAEAIPARPMSLKATTTRSFESTLNKVEQPATLPTKTLQPIHTSTQSQSPSPDWIQKLINEKSEKYNVPAPLISSIVKAESAFNPNAVSSAGAQGLMQLMPGTARDMGVQNAFDPAQNIEGGVKYFKQMLDRFGNNIEHALAAYNAGPGNVSKYGGVPPFRETQKYVQKIMNDKNMKTLNNV